MSSTFPDLTTNFPDSIDPLRIFRNVDITSQPLVLLYYDYINSGKFNEANQLIINNPILKETLLTADLVQLMYDQAIASQRFYLSDFQKYIINAIQYKGVWLPTVQYPMLSVVYHEGFSYMAVKQDIPIGALPTDINYWVAQTIKGDQGNTGLGLSPRGIWSNAISYGIHDMVTYEGKFWYAINDNLNSIPYEGSLNWVLAPVIIPLSGIETETTKTNVMPNGTISVDLKKETVFDFDNLAVLWGVERIFDPTVVGQLMETIRVRVSGVLVATRKTIFNADGTVTVTETIYANGTTILRQTTITTTFGMVITEVVS